MEEVSLTTLRKIALQLHTEGLDWHFHILTPGCKLNEKPLYAFVVEDVSNTSSYVVFSNEAQKQLGSELAPLLHGATVFSSNKQSLPSDMETIIARAEALNKQGLAWHHHVLFPGCQYNQAADKFTLVFEDPEVSSPVLIVSDTEPKALLSRLEPLFYSQRQL